MVKKKIVMLALTAVLLLTTYSVPVSAAENAAVIGTVASAQTIAPLWESTKTVVPSISISGKQISVSVYISPISSTTTTTGKLYLEKKSGNGWAPVTSWPIDVTGKVDIHSCPCVGRGFLGRKLLRSLLGTRRWKQLECLLLFQ